MRNPFRHPAAPSPDTPRPNELAAAVAARNRLTTGLADSRADSADGAPIPGLDDETEADVRGLIERVAMLSPDEGRRLISFWKTVDGAARSQAHEEAQGAARESGLSTVVNRLQEEAGRAVAWRFSATAVLGAVAAEYGLPNPAPSLGPLQTLSEAVTWPVIDAVAATVLSDWLSDKAYDALYTPWERAIDEFEPPANDVEGAEPD